MPVSTVSNSRFHTVVRYPAGLMGPPLVAGCWCWSPPPPPPLIPRRGAPSPTTSQKRRTPALNTVLGRGLVLQRRYLPTAPADTTTSLLRLTHFFSCTPARLHSSPPSPCLLRRLLRSLPASTYVVAPGPKPSLTSPSSPIDSPVSPAAVGWPSAIDSSRHSFRRELHRRSLSLPPPFLPASPLLRPFSRPRFMQDSPLPRI
ncbi:hypothetical protein XA68_15836 [Ophiocordyceps unilateralis]|uniref:Uncharacterized protein n=1 Tax=Ophiocordyceps unilateralis TaxID=268505 RepID=A0A2A9P7Q5_OPHUN|nr:hypothetical protein XA68_15836 [Ophiocordyceps unilateralis]